MACRCGQPDCALSRRDHYCTVCGLAHYSAIEAWDCCDTEVAPDD